MRAEQNTWQLIESLFAELAELPPHQRSAFLDSGCRDNAGLRAELESLLAAHDSAGDFLSGLDAGQVAELIEDTDSQPAETRIGRFRIKHELGRGGMGVVYLAERDDGQFQQTVALKLVKHGIDSNDMLQRFRNERQILARLHHPNIVRLLDGGISENNRPWFAMEYINGVPLTRYCDAHRMDITSRLRLFIKVCRAVLYAHDNKVIHRDLKPSNILVTDDMEVKLLDFGVAKIVGGEKRGDAVNPETPAHHQLFTPVYASPEQVCNKSVTSATDIYSLGIILYELLAGVRPYELSHNPGDNLVTTIRDTPPQLPSLMLTNMLKAPAINGSRNVNNGNRAVDIRQLAANRNMTLNRFLRIFRYDLEAIIMTAMHKDKEHRYGSVTQLVQDVENYLQNRPVSSRAGSVFCRVSKFFQRHKLAATSIMLALVAVLASSTLVFIQQKTAAYEEEKAAIIYSFLQDMLLCANPGTQDTANNVSLNTVNSADRQLQLNNNAFKEHPRMEASLRKTIGGLYLSLGKADKASGHLSTAAGLDNSSRGIQEVFLSAP